jgi:hypothetical protein
MKKYFSGFGLAVFSSLVLAGIHYLFLRPSSAKVASDRDVLVYISMMLIIPVLNGILAFRLKNKYGKQFFWGVMTVALIELPLLVFGLLLLTAFGNYIFSNH